MDLKLDLSVAVNYTSKSQIARVITEKWVGRQIYCPSCGNPSLNDFANNSPVADFYCNSCKSEYELKSKKDSFNFNRIVDGAYQSMIERINSTNNPNFFFLNYSSSELIVDNFIVIPKHYFTNDIIEKRKPLSQNARRAGWIGCNILLQDVPESGKIHMVKNRQMEPPEQVMKKWAKTFFLADQKQENRGWIIEIMRILDKIKKINFTLSEVYEYESELQKKFPNNKFVKDKIRQQLQVLRDKNYIEFKGNGQYRKL